ncbi:MAG TPA: hypothetical protein PKA38_00875 [Candidatus Levybacteria bacterium]|nr:hypothetical protein [Candidatus Levybacteria bacterium]
MEHSSPVAKVVATATSSSWAQAYSAGKLHLVVSLCEEGKETIASLGKDTLERLQREFFALDEKNLETLKRAVETVVGELSKNVSLSLVLTTIVNSTLYIIIAHSGSVLLRRGGKTIIIATGEPNTTTGFSGIVEPEDIILVATEGLLTTVSSDEIEKSLSAGTPHNISESIAPFIHDNPTGKEAALIWSMIGERKVAEEDEAAPDNDTLDLTNTEEKEKVVHIPKFHLEGIIKKIKLPSLRNFSKKQLIVICVLVLLVVLAIAIFLEKTGRENAHLNEQAQLILSENKQKYEDAIALMSLNKSLAIEELSEIKSNVESKISQFPPESNARKSLGVFLESVNKSLGEDASGRKSKINVFFDARKNTEIPNIVYITAKGGEIAVIGSSKGGLLTSDGSVVSTFNGVGSVYGITADEKNVYILTGETVERVTKSNGEIETIIEKQANPISIDTFGGNIYLLSKTDKTIYKYLPESFGKAAYFTGDTTIQNPSSLAIDASIYVIENGSIKKYTRGKEDSFSYKGKALSTNSRIYTDIDYANLYILDPEKKIVYVVDKNGNLVLSIPLSGMKAPKSIAADEKEKKIYVVSENKVYSVDY